MRTLSPADRNIRLVTLYTLCLNAIFVIPVIVPYYREELGLGFREFMIGEAVFAAVIVLMEVPTGWLADIWTRKKTMLAGMAVNIIGYFWLWRAQDFFDAVAAQAIIGVSVSLLSGTVSALLYDSLLSEGREEEYRRREGFRVGFGLYVVGAASLAGGFLYVIDPRLPALLSFLTSIAGLAVVLFISEPPRHRAPAHKNPFADMAQTVKYALHGHAEVAGIIILSAVLFAGTKTLMWSQQPYYEMLGVPTQWFGALCAMSFMLGGLGGHLGHVFDGRFRNVALLKFFMAWVCAVCVICALAPGYAAIPVLLTGSSLVFGLGWPRMQAAINNRVGSERRATILSAANLSISCVAIPLLAIIGQAEKAGGIAGALLFLAAIIAAGGVGGTLLIGRINGRRQPHP